MNFRLPLILFALVLTACAPLAPQPKPAEKRYTAAELLALQPSSLAWPTTSTDGERALREQALADIRASIALPPGPVTAQTLVTALDRVAKPDQPLRIRLPAR